MLQIDHVYEFLYQELFKDFVFWSIPNGVPKLENINIFDVTVFTHNKVLFRKFFFYDQEPVIPKISDRYMDMFTWDNNFTVDELTHMAKTNSLLYDIKINDLSAIDHIVSLIKQKSEKNINVLVTSEFSKDVDSTLSRYNLKKLYYFFHGFAALDWYRGYYALNYNKQIVNSYKYDFISFNRIITDDRSYRIYFVSLLKEQELLNHGQVSFNVTDNLFDDWQDETADPNSKLSANAKQHIEHHLTDINKLVIDRAELPGSVSADIPRDIDAFWHIVTETVFYYDKLHLTEKIFKPIVSKQPFMLLAAPGNLAYLRSYGFKTFDGIIDESYDSIQNNDHRIEAVVKQLHWYCNLSEHDKTDIMRAIEPIVTYNFHHFYGEFKQIITQELITNTKTLFKEIDYDDQHINYASIQHVLSN